MPVLTIEKYNYLFDLRVLLNFFRDFVKTHANVTCYIELTKIPL